MRRTAVIAILVLIAFTAVAGSACGAFAALTRVTKTIPASVTVQLRVCGDMNGDASVNVFDAILDLQIIVGLVQPSSAQLILGDVVRDGQINVFDAILALQHIVGLTVITSCGPEPPPSGLVSWWTGDGNAQDLVDGNHGTLQGGADFAPGMVDLAVQFRRDRRYCERRYCNCVRPGPVYGRFLDECACSAPGFYTSSVKMGTLHRRPEFLAIYLPPRSKAMLGRLQYSARTGKYMFWDSVTSWRMASPSWLLQWDCHQAVFGRSTLNSEAI